MTVSDLRSVAVNQERLEQYQRLTQQAAWVDFSDRTQIELLGRDRQKFLNNFCTNDIVRLQPGQGCEAFVTSVQGKCLGHIFVFVGEESVVVETTPGQAVTLLAHWDRYLITEDVQMHDRSQTWAELLVIGPHIRQLLPATISPEMFAQDYAHARAVLGEVETWVRRVPMTTQPTYLWACQQTQQTRLQDSLQDLGIAAVSRAAFHMLRVEQGFPWYGWDITDQNLPQEVQRNTQAISFQKGCYLGQETVARLDALGHVNRLLTGVRCESNEVPSEGDELSRDGAVVGRITSAAYSPRLNNYLALSYVRCQLSTPGTALSLPSTAGRVVNLPLAEEGVD